METVYKTFVFDLDGTLLNTLNDLAQATNYALRVHGMAERTVDEVRRFVGNGVRRLIEQAVAPGTDSCETGRVLATFQSYYLQHSLDATLPYRGIPEMLAILRERGCRLAVVSNKFDAATKALCRHFFPDTIEVAIGEHEAQGIRKKPAPDTVIEALRQLGVSSAGAVYVGDSDVDILTARNSNLPCISVLWGFRDREFLQSHGATTFVETPMELCKL